MFKMPQPSILRGAIEDCLEAWYPEAEYYLVTDLTPEAWEAWSFAVSATGRRDIPMPVEANYSDRTIFEDAKVNYKFRLWHDSVHHELGIGFDFKDELLVAAKQLDQLYTVGYNRDVRRVFEAETAGMQVYHQLAGEFPTNQKRFTELYCASGMQEFLLGYRT